MSAWKHAYFFSSPIASLNPIEGGRLLDSKGCGLCSELMFTLTQVDDIHFEADTSQTSSKGIESAEEWMNMHNAQCAFEFRAIELPIFLTSVSLGTPPYISWGWQSSFDAFPGDLGTTSQRYLKLMCEFALVTNSAYVVIAVEPSGYAEDRFVPVLGRLNLQNKTSHPAGYGFKEVWFNPNLGVVKPDGVMDEFPKEIDFGYLRCEIAR